MAVREPYEAQLERQVIQVRDALGCLPDDDTVTRATEVYAARDRALIDLEAVRAENDRLRSMLATRRLPWWRRVGRRQDQGAGDASH